MTPIIALVNAYDVTRNCGVLLAPFNRSTDTYMCVCARGHNRERGTKIHCTHKRPTPCKHKACMLLRVAFGAGCVVYLCYAAYSVTAVNVYIRK